LEEASKAVEKAMIDLSEGAKERANEKAFMWTSEGTK
jgi:hypothetical protein